MAFPRPTKLNRIIEQAETLGLVVEVHDMSGDDFEQYRVEITRPQVEEHNMLDVVRNREQLWVYVSRSKSRAPSAGRVSAIHYGYMVPSRDIRPKVLPHAIEQLAEGAS